MENTILKKSIALDIARACMQTEREMIITKKQDAKASVLAFNCASSLWQSRINMLIAFKLHLNKGSIVRKVNQRDLLKISIHLQ